MRKEVDPRVCSVCKKWNLAEEVMGPLNGAKICFDCCYKRLQQVERELKLLKNKERIWQRDHTAVIKVRG